MSSDLFMDKRLQEKSLRDKKIDRKALDAVFDALEDSSHNLMEFDEEGNPTNELERELKTLPVYTAEEELYKVEVELEVVPDALVPGAPAANPQTVA